MIIGASTNSAFAWLQLRNTLRERLSAGETHLGEAAVRDVFANSPIPFGKAVTCDSTSAAVAAAESLGFPVVLKALDPAVLHKSEAGLVRTNLADAAAVQAASTQLATRGTLCVQRQLTGVEVSVGAVRDPLGPMLAVGAGGTLIELLEDTALRIAPVSRAEAHAMLRELRLGAVLHGYRGTPPVDLDALLDLIVAVGDLVVAVPEIAELDLNPVFASEHGCWAADGRVRLTEAMVDRGRPLAAEAVRRLLEPRRVAVVGGSDNTSKSGGLLLRYLKKHAFPGEVVTIHPGGQSIANTPTFARITDAPGRIDLACIAVPAAQVSATVADCVAAGVPAGIIYSAGFSESGDDGRRRQQELDQRADGFRYIGPNSLGVVSTHRPMVISAAMGLEDEHLTAGSVGFVTHSGAIGSALLGRVAEFGLGFSHWISCGNEADLDVADHIAYLADDPQTKLICLVLEVVRRPANFARACEAALAAGKPLLCLKAGRSGAARQAIASHTAAVAGPDDRYAAFLRRCGVVRMSSLTGLLAGARGLLTAGPIRGRRVAVVGMSGGISSLMADACEQAGLELPAWPADAQRKLEEIIPAYGSAHNPIDLTTAVYGRPGMAGEVIGILRDSGAVDGVLVQLSTNADPSAASIADDLVRYSLDRSLPVLIGRLGARSLAPRAMAAYVRAGVHVFTWPEHLVDAASACVQFGEIVERTWGPQQADEKS